MIYFWKNTMLDFFLYKLDRDLGDFFCAVTAVGTSLLQITRILFEKPTCFRYVHVSLRGE